jgi:aspartyl-tRNA(Asn)/glutamyl-tRNA(Gln) amidotransferase subunit A
MNELVSQSATSLAALIRERSVSPVEVVDAYLVRIQEVNPKLNAIVTVAPDVREKASQAEAAIMRGELTGPLHGVPLTTQVTCRRVASAATLQVPFVFRRTSAASPD